MPDGDGFSADPRQLADRAAQFEPLATRLSAIHRGLTDALEGTPWGADAVGRSFASVHAGPADDVVGRLSSLSARLGSVGTRLGDSAGTYRSVDESAIVRLKAAEQ